MCVCVFVCVCVCVRARACVRACVHVWCVSSIGGQTAGPIMTKFGTYMRIDREWFLPKKKWSHIWSGRVGSLGPFVEAGT